MVEKLNVFFKGSLDCYFYYLSANNTVYVGTEAHNTYTHQFTYISGYDNMKGSLRKIILQRFPMNPLQLHNLMELIYN